MKTCPLCDSAYPNHQTNCSTDGALLIESRELEPGTLIRGKYRIVRLLGRGGMGTVYLADHILLGRQRALKFISSELSQDPRFLKRFRHEAQAASELRQANVVEVVDLDQAEDGSPYIAMEFVDGTDLRHALAAGAFPVERALAIARGIAQGLSAAHAKGIIHRDVKPENILLARGNGGAETPKLLDFGIAAMKESATAVSRTRGLMLTPEYASPEQWKGMASEELDCRADLYALGGVLYEMLTGQTAFHAHNTEGWMYQHLQEEPQPPSRLRPELKSFPGLDELVLRLLAKDRELRFSSAAAVIEALSLKPPVVRPPTLFEDYNKPDSTTVLQEKRSGSRKWAVAAAVIAAGLGIWLISRFLLPSDATAVPVLSPGPGTYASPQPVAISDATPNAVIHYTVDGSSPTEASTVYTQPVTSLPSGAVVRAMAKAEGHAPSPDVTAVYIWSGTGSDGATKLQGGTAYDQGKFAYDHKQYAQARTLFGPACDGGDTKACNYLGFLYARGLGGAPDQAKAREVYAGACERANMNSCASLGSLYQDAKDNANARVYFQKACDGKLAEGCELLRGLE
jgi:serine/threonine-protein kinase